MARRSGARASVLSCRDSTRGRSPPAPWGNHQFVDGRRFIRQRRSGQPSVGRAVRRAKNGAHSEPRRAIHRKRRRTFARQPAPGGIGHAPPGPVMLTWNPATETSDGGTAGPTAGMRWFVPTSLRAERATWHKRASLGGPASPRKRRVAVRMDLRSHGVSQCIREWHTTKRPSSSRRGRRSSHARGTSVRRSRKEALRGALATVQHLGATFVDEFCSASVMSAGLER
jgi:hypothetical protein